MKYYNQGPQTRYRKGRADGFRDTFGKVVEPPTRLFLCTTVLVNEFVGKVIIKRKRYFPVLLVLIKRLRKYNLFKLHKVLPFCVK